MRVICVGTIENVRWDKEHKNQYANILAFGGREKLEISNPPVEGAVDLFQLPTDKFLEMDLEVAFYTTGDGRETRQRAKLLKFRYAISKVSTTGAGLFSAPVESGSALK